MGYSVINPQSHSEALKQNWKLLHAINIFLLTTSLPFWFFTPFLTRGVDNDSNKFFRLLSVGYAIAAGAGSLYLSTELAEIKPKIDAIKKREQAEFKHGVASDLFLAQGTNTAIAQYLLAERDNEFSSEQFTDPELLNDSENTPGVQNGSELVNDSVQTVQNRSGNSSDEPSPESLEHLDAVIEALEDGISDSLIIKKVMGFNNYRYKVGKQYLKEIKQFLELE
ncbi:MAG: hypothetical protein ACRC78_07180 [Planktothrix sp.]